MLAALSDMPIVQAVISKKPSIDAIIAALMKNYSNVLLVQQTSRMLANSIKSMTDSKKGNQLVCLPVRVAFCM
jgi:endonuclease V-like protein UPF0215 family